MSLCGRVLEKVDRSSSSVGKRIRALEKKRWRVEWMEGADETQQAE